MYEKEYRELKALNKNYNRLLQSVSRAASVGDLARIHADLNEVTADIFLRSGSIAEVHQRCTSYRDKLTFRIIALTSQQMRAEHGNPRGAFAWIRMGSTGRDEQTLYTDQDNLLVYKNKRDEPYYRAFAARMVTNLATIGFARCRGNIMPTNDKWFGTLDEWKVKLHDYIVGSDNLIDLIVLSDAKYSGGNAALAKQFLEETHTVMKMYQASFKAIAKATLLMPIALTIFKGFKTEKKGEYKDMLNVKYKGWLPLIMLTLLFSLENDIWETNTIKRIKALEKLKVFEPDFAEGLMASYNILTGYKLMAQIDFLKGKTTSLTYYINPFKLEKREQNRLKQALSTVEKFQRLASSSYNINEDAL
jgi:signal-transduction protein with cAMP-binding, CBS, and nucleotidyltransferase domain